MHTNDEEDDEENKIETHNNENEFEQIDSTEIIKETPWTQT